MYTSARASLTLCIPVTPKCVYSKTVKTQMKFHQSLRYLLRQKRSSEKEIQINLEIITSDPSIYTMHHKKFIDKNRRKKRVKLLHHLYLMRYKWGIGKRKMCGPK